MINLPADTCTNTRPAALSLHSLPLVSATLPVNPPHVPRVPSVRICMPSDETSRLDPCARTHPPLVGIARMRTACLRRSHARSHERHFETVNFHRNTERWSDYLDGSEEAERGRVMGGGTWTNTEKSSEIMKPSFNTKIEFIIKVNKRVRVFISTQVF